MSLPVLVLLDAVLVNSRTLTPQQALMICTIGAEIVTQIAIPVQVLRHQNVQVAMGLQMVVWITFRE